MSIYKNFRDYQRVPASRFDFSKRFDQPTYMSFRLVFGGMSNIGAAGANDEKYNKISPVNYDVMPHPLFGKRSKTTTDNRQTYSAIDYLIDANEFTRASMLENFIRYFNQMQLDYQYYFQSVEGVGDLLKIDTKKGIRVPSDKRLSITMLEGLDLRSSYLLNMYRKIAWDDVYQRWILPDMMRYFTLDIYVTEFRIFHSPNQWGGMGLSEYPDSPVDQTVLRVINDVFPSWVIKCEMCEFDMSTFDFSYLSNLNVAKEKTESEIKFGIKVGRIYEEQVYPTLYTSVYLIDKRLNSFERSKKIEAGEELPFDSTNPIFNESNNAARNNFEVGQNIIGVRKNEEREGKHTSGQPFNRPGEAPGGALKTVRYDKKPGDDGRFEEEEINPTEPRTWARNIKTFGRAFGRNLLDTAKDKASVTPIGGGISFNEAQSALQSRDVMTVFGAARIAINRAIDYWYGNEAPSARLESNYMRRQPKIFDTVQSVTGEISDVISTATQTASSMLFDPKQFESNLEELKEKIGEFGVSQPLPSNLEGMANDAFRLFLEGLTRSQATDAKSGALIDAAGQILANPALFDRVSSYSLESGLIDTFSPPRDEIQAGGSIDPQSASVELSNVSMPRIIIEGVPTSVATNNRIIKG